jgi:hypothetical protein
MSYEIVKIQLKKYLKDEASDEEESPGIKVKNYDLALKERVLLNKRN